MRACDYNSDPWSHVLRCNTRSPFSWLSAFFSYDALFLEWIWNCDFDFWRDSWRWILAHMCFMGEKNIAGSPPSLCTSEKSRHQTRWHQSGRQEGTHYLLKTNDATIKKLTRAAYRLYRIQKPFTHIWRWNWKFFIMFHTPCNMIWYFTQVFPMFFKAMVFYKWFIFGIMRWYF